MAKHKQLTDVEVAELCSEPNTEGWQDGLYRVADHLFIQVRGNSRTWQVRWYNGPRVTTMGLGSTTRVTPKEAKRQTTESLAHVMAGRDPRAVRDTELAETGQKPVSRAPAASATARTFREVAREYINEHEPGWRSPLHSRQWTQTLRDYVYPTIGGVTVDRVTVDHVVDVLKPIWREKHVTAGKVKTRIAQILDWAEAHKWRSGDNPARAKAVEIRLGNGVHRTVKHFEAIPYPQMPAFWSALAADDSTAADVVRFMILTAVRPSEALGARWEEVDLDQRVWTVPGERMKMGHPHRVALSEEAVGILSRRLSQSGEPASGLIFPSTAGKTLDRAMPRKIIQRLGFDATAHGCRSSFADWSREIAKADREVRELALAHREQNAAVAAYSRSDLLEARRLLMQQWADYLAGKAPS